MSQNTLPYNAMTIDRANHIRDHYDAVAPAGHTLEDVLSPIYFTAHRGNKGANKNMRVGSFINITAHDGSWYVQLCVRAVPAESGDVFTQIVAGPVRFDEELDSGSPYKIEGDTQGGYAIHDKKTGALIEGGLSTQAEAVIRADFLEDKAADDKRKAARSRKRQTTASKVAAE